MREESNRLIEKGTFQPVPIHNVPEDVRILPSRFIDQGERVNEGVRKKSRQVAQNSADAEATKIAKKAATVHVFCQRFFLGLGASMKAMENFARDITKAYVQSETSLERDVFILRIRKVRLPANTALKVVRHSMKFLRVDATGS